MQRLMDSAFAKSVVAHIVSPRYRPGAKPLLQHELDVYRLYQLAARRALGEVPSESGQPSDNAALHARRLHEICTQQALDLLQMCASPSALAQAPFALDVRPSGVAHAAAGDGLFLAPRSAPVPPGTVVAMWPGRSYAAESLPLLPGYPHEIAQRNPYLISRIDGVLLDGRALWAEGGDEGSGEGAGEEAGVGERHENVWAKAQYANHAPPAHAAPNVLTVAYDWALPRLPAELAPYLPNAAAAAAEGAGLLQRAKRWGRGEAAAPGLLLMTLRGVAPGEELLLNYRCAAWWCWCCWCWCWCWCWWCCRC